MNNMNTTNQNLEKYNHPLIKVFYILLGVFGLFIATLFLIGTLLYAPLTTLLGFVAFLLGIVLIILTIKAKVKGYQKLYLFLTGSSPIAGLISVILHNLFEYFAETTAAPVSTILGILSIAFFYIAIFVFPIAFIVGIVGSIVFFKKEKK